MYRTDTRHDNVRMSDATFLINVAHLVKNETVSSEQQHDRIEQIVATLREKQVTLDDGQPVTFDKVQRDVDVGEYLARWVTEFGRVIYFWGGFNIDIDQEVPRDQFDRILLYLRDYPQKRDGVRSALKALWPEHLVVPSSVGGRFRTPYRTLFVIP